MMGSWTRETLLAVGFVDVGYWRASGEAIDYELDGEHAEANRVLMGSPNALYAFVRGEDVQYIGKTTRGVRKRFVGYKRPGRLQQTNLRCNANIKKALKDAAEIRILVFTPIANLRYLDFEINLAAGLEDSLIKALDPPWNGREKGFPISEETEREEAEEKADGEAAVIPEPDKVEEAQRGGQAVVTFTIRLGTAYYDHGFINPG